MKETSNPKSINLRFHTKKFWKLFQLLSAKKLSLGIR